MWRNDSCGWGAKEKIAEKKSEKNSGFDESQTPASLILVGFSSNKWAVQPDSKAHFLGLFIHVKESHHD